MKASWALCSLAPLAAGLSGEPEEVAGLDPVQPAMIPVAGLGPATHVFGAELSLPQGDRDRGKLRSSTPPPPPCVRVRTRRFGGGIMRRPGPEWEDRWRRRRRWTERLGGRGAD